MRPANQNEIRRAARAPLAALLALLGPAWCSCTPARVSSVATPVVEHFDGTQAPPANWRIGTTNERSGTEDAEWAAASDASAPSPPDVLALVDARGHVGQAFNLCWNPGLSLTDVDVTVSVHVGGGEEDQGGGPAWRIAGVDDYYVARWNPLEDNFRVYSVQGGERLQLDSARVRVDADVWHTIRVRQVGDSITCWFDGEELLHAEDTKLREPGGVGVWTKADATTLFDDLVVDAARDAR